MGDQKIKWLAQWDQALAEAKERNLHVLLDFYLPG